MSLTAPTTQTLTGAQYALKVRYLGSIRKQFNESTVFFSKLAKRTESVSGKNFTIALHTKGQATAGLGTGDGLALKAPSSQTVVNAIIPNSYQYSQMRITGPTIAASRDNVGAFANMLEFEVDNLLKNMKRSFNRQFHSDGTDALAYWTGADNTTPATVDDNQGNAFVHLPSGTTTVDIIDATDHATKLGDSIPLVLGAKGAADYSVSWASGTISGTADTDYAVFEDTLGYQMMGLAGIVATGNPPLGSLQGIDATAVGNEYWRAQANTNSGTLRQFDFADLQSVIDDIASQSTISEGDVDLLLCNYPVRREYFKACIVERRHVNTMELDGGFKALDYNGIPFVADSQCKRNRIYVLAMKSLALLRMSDFEWMDKDGSYLNRVDGYDAYMATLFHYGNLAVYDRNCNGLYGDILES